MITRVGVRLPVAAVVGDGSENDRECKHYGYPQSNLHVSSDYEWESGRWYVEAS